ncbi:MAG TPA: B12-binding domain-containing protein [Bdellovibrionales bacterium]|nr:B12-binding domain-containing protein [Bdellovibrionales bacterium]
MALSLKTTQLPVDTRTFLFQLVAPFFRSVGDLVESGELDVFHEHAASAVLRNILSGLLYSTERATHFSGEPPIIFAVQGCDLQRFK